jgi:hypothetical protein
MLYMLEKFRFNRVGLDGEKSGNMLEKLKWGAGGRRFKSSRPDQFSGLIHGFFNSLARIAGLFFLVGAIGQDRECASTTPHFQIKVFGSAIARPAFSFMPVSR